MATISLRKGPRGTTYRVQVRRFGAPALSATFRNQDEARAWAEAQEARIESMRRGGMVEAAGRTLSDLLDQYYADAECDPDIKLSDAKRKHLEWWRGELGDMRLVDVTRGQISERLTSLARGTKILGGKTIRTSRKQRTGATVNRYHASLSSVLTYAVRRLYWLERNPCREVDRRREGAARDRVLTAAERNRLLEACEASEWPGLIVLTTLALSTGARRGELLALRWRHVDLTAGELYFPKTKNGDPRRVPVVEPALSHLQNWSKVRHIDSDLVFPSLTDPAKPFVGFWKYWNKALADAEIEGFVFHGLRHQAGTDMASAGIPTTTIARALGHKTLNMTLRYAKADTDTLRRAFERTAEHVGRS